jgi:hypothetical protein
MRPQGVNRTLAWLAFGSLAQSILLAGFFLVPFSHLWGVMPVSADVAADAATADWVGPLILGVLFAVPSLLPFVFLVYQPRLTWQLPVSVGAIGLILLPAVVALATYPCCGGDVLEYVNRQRLWVVYGGNPYSVIPNQYPDDWSYAFINFKDTVFGYGPVWWLVGRAFTYSADNLAGYLLGFKAIAAICFAAPFALIWRLSDERNRLLNLVFFAWNPVILIDGVLRLHNDLMTVPFVLGAVWLWSRGRVSSACVATALGSLVKLTVAPLCLVLLIALVAARRWRTLACAALAGLVVSAALYAPFWVGTATLTPLIWQASALHWSLGTAMVYALGLPALPLVRWLMIGGCLGLWAVCLRQFARGEPTAARLAATAALLVLIGALSVPMAFYAHYLTPVIALAAVAGDARLRSLVLAVSFASMLNGVLGIDSLVGGVHGALLDVTGSGVLIVALGVALVRGGWFAGLRGVRTVARAQVAD